ncbi:hypothetical protein [Sutterella sp.]|uniref:hypothetical protein n=1 Tax=Sutterella sp. TaxID=1981025 RepID=UPI003FD74745
METSRIQKYTPYTGDCQEKNRPAQIFTFELGLVDAFALIYGVRRILFSGFEDKGSWFNISLKRFQQELINLPGSLITKKRGILLEINQALQHPEVLLIIFGAKYDATKYQKLDRNKPVFY